MKHIKTGEPLLVPRKTIAQFLAMTIADFAEQLFSWQVWVRGAGGGGPAGGWAGGGGGGAAGSGTWRFLFTRLPGALLLGSTA